jgi:hypothetical protein
MKMDDFTRRDVLNRLLKIVGLATGLSVVEIQSLLAQRTSSGKTPAAPLDKKAAGALKKVNKDLKTLKVLLENNIQVFENEFGRATPTVSRPLGKVMSQKKLPPGLQDQIVQVCGRNFSMAGAANKKAGLGLCIGVNTCAGQDLTGPDGPCTGTNTCSGQSCPHNYICDDNTCQSQKCPKFVDCGKNNESIVNAALLQEFKDDPYVQQLFREFKVNTAPELARQIQLRLQTMVR